jgi:hypothetical protein
MKRDVPNATKVPSVYVASDSPAAAMALLSSLGASS